MSKRLATVVVLILGGASVMLTLANREEASTVEPFALGGKVKRLSGDHVRLKDGRTIEFAAVRLPYDFEPYAEKSRVTLHKWIDDEGVRLQFDELRTYKDDRIFAYVYANDTFINLRLVRDGLAFVKLRKGHRGHAKELLEAQAAARAENRGIWGSLVPGSSGRFVLDEPAASFHLPTCSHIEQRSDLPVVEGLQEAFDRGAAPCGKCRPLEM